MVALTDAGTGRQLAEVMTQAAQSKWDGWLKKAFHGHSVPETPGFPSVQWVVIPFSADAYQDGWERAQGTLAARKRIRSFPGYHVDQQGICALTGRWPSVPEAQAPAAAGNVRRTEALSAVGHAKRWYGRRRGSRFPSTWSIASAPYRDAIIRRGENNDAFGESLWDAVAGLYTEVEALCATGDEATRTALRRGSGELPGIVITEDEALGWLRRVEGAWCVPETWTSDGLRRDYDLAVEPSADQCEKGRKAALALSRSAAGADMPPLTPYLAVVAQDADHMGAQLARFPADIADPVAWHRGVSGALGDVAQSQREKVQSGSCLGTVVYAGGDDLLALVPAERALTAAREVNLLFAEDGALAAMLGRPSASTAIVFFHASWPLQSAVAGAQALLQSAKDRARPGLGVSVLTRGGERACAVLPWLDRAATPARPVIEYLEDLAATISGPLSGRLAAGLEEDRHALAELSRGWLERELTRRAARQGFSAEQAPAAGHLLAALCGSAPGEQGFIDCAESVVIARFLAAQRRRA